MQKIYEIQISVSINKALLEHSHVHSFTSLAAFMLQRQSEAVGRRDHFQPIKLKMFTVWPLREKVCQPWSYTTSLSFQNDFDPS